MKDAACPISTKEGKGGGGRPQRSRARAGRLSYSSSTVLHQPSHFSQGGNAGKGWGGGGGFLQEIAADALNRDLVGVWVEDTHALASQENLLGRVLRARLVLVDSQDEIDQAVLPRPRA